MALPKRTYRWAIPALFLILCVVLSPVWLRALGRFLVREQPPYKAGMIVVLAGDFEGNRILKAAQLVKEGFAPRILVSGPNGMYGHYESDYAIDFAVSKGYPREWFVPSPNESLSTLDEAGYLLRDLGRRKVARFLIVTSDYHTRRAGSIYRHLAPKADFRVVAAPDWAFHADSWWRSRPGRKQCAMEWLKTFADWVGI